jgi:hypothetical protein
MKLINTNAIRTEGKERRVWLFFIPFLRGYRYECTGLRFREKIRRLDGYEVSRRPHWNMLDWEDNSDQG